MSGPVAIAIPLLGKNRAQSWERLKALLAHTLLSIFRQRSQNYRLVIAYNDRPEGTLFDDPRINYLWVPPVDSEERVHGDSLDKYVKLQALQRWAAESDAEYYFPLDNDDLLSDRLVEYVTTSPPAVGFIVTRSYAYDGRTQRLSPLPHPREPHMTFDSWCGSAILTWMDPKDLAEDRFRRLDAIWKEGHYHVRAQFPVIAGAAASELPFPGVLYRLNTGENMYLRFQRERGGEHLSDWVFDEQAFMPDEKLRSEFALSRLRNADFEPLGTTFAY